MTPAIGSTPVFADRLAAIARHAPERIALVWSGGASWTYARLMQHADAIAGSLLDRGVERGELVGICVPRTPEMVAAMLGVMRAGAASLALDPVFPLEQLDYMAAHARVRHLLVARTAGVPALLAADRNCLELHSLDVNAVHAHALPAVGGDDLAYTMFTSGSTGKPKGVRTLHRNLTGFLESAQRILGIDAHAVAGAFSTLAFDSVVLDLYLPLFAGARVVLASEGDQDDPAAAAALRQAHHMTTLFVPPAQLRLLQALGRLDELHGMSIWSGGEALPRDLAEAVLPHCRELWNLYGPTETTVAATMQRVTHGNGPVPIGTPITDTRVYLLNDSLVPVPAGETGEIWIGGAGVADGYLDDPERTAERFVPDPFAADGSRMYRSGDLGALRDGLLYFHGRNDDQIKLNGFRIEPGEVEAAALAEHGVHQAVAMAHATSDGDQRLILYVVADHAPDFAMRLRAALRKRLPGYVRLHYIETLDAMPLTPSGKIDRKALPLPRALTEDANPRELGRQMPGSGMAANPTVSPHRNAWSPLVSIQPRGNRLPLFLVHDIDGSVHHYVALARSLGAEQPVYGIQAIGLDGNAPPIASLQIMSACYLAEIRRVQPHGPYFLGGSSMGGMIACEMARQLREQGEPIGLLAMMDIHGFGSQPATPKGGWLSLQWMVAMPFARLLRAIDEARVHRARTHGKALPHALRHREIERVHRHALISYQPQPSDQRVVLFTAKRSPRHATRMETFDWKSCMQGGVEVIELPDTGDALIEQPELLDQLRKLLDRAQTSARHQGTA